ncbi:hypothetical protein BDV25DRAFT_170297 [Aspergillus avenaceus]|uniref:Ilp is an apoptosis inhibitor n=1 Tax=Aspergillus avenaceus TaxID=36643 RepID=A0A5N6TH31_ASPAV|nr:hypothetical protein BDV25DRAFT_170297 [Aspergillus avenaceus]
MDVQGSGRNYWESSPCMDMHESAPITPVTYLPTKPSLESGYQGNGATDVAGAPDSPFVWDMSPNMEMPTPMPEAPVETEYSQVDLNDWYPRHLACMQYFVDQGQHSIIVQSLAAFINIRLPYQRFSAPVTQFSAPPSMNSRQGVSLETPAHVPLRPYIRRLIATANDTPAVLQAFFGNDWQSGVGCICKQERINYLFTAKSEGWSSTKAAYDILPDEQTPFLRPLREPTEEELRIAESRWSEWLAMEDWMVGPRSPW